MTIEDIKALKHVSVEDLGASYKITSENGYYIIIGDEDHIDEFYGCTLMYTPKREDYPDYNWCTKARYEKLVKLQEEYYNQQLEEENEPVL